MTEKERKSSKATEARKTNFELENFDLILGPQGKYPFVEDVT